MKLFIVVLALAFGLGLVSVALAIQSNQLAFTSRERKASATPTVPIRTGTTQIVNRSRTIQLDEVLVLGRFNARPAPPKRRAPVADTLIHVVTPPCVDGAYRKLEDKRGVRMSCPATL